MYQYNEGLSLFNLELTDLIADAVNGRRAHFHSRSRHIANMLQL